jgi:diaminohydroxyphosphoribosylaminopyrimidine deaminase / 5-amino-6-(5-phosphoribosylamino)uracil reductase
VNITDEVYLKRCLELAAEGSGNVAPNPLVGSVVVYNDRIIGEGYHRRFGEAHAEVNALGSVSDRSLLKSSRLFVNLEPCAHTGKTPPCADMIIQNGIPEVIIGSVDPNPLVSGKGIEKLRSAGIKVRSGVMKKESDYLNRRFFTYHNRKRPFIILKWAKSSDGMIDIMRENGGPDRPVWISNEISRMLVHKWRSEEQGILVGTNTAFLDNPRLNIREWKGNDPVRMVIDKSLLLPDSLSLYDGSQHTVVFNGICDKAEGATKYIKTGFGKSFLSDLLGHIYDEQIQSVIVEGGKMLLGTFIDSGMWDEARVFTGDRIFGKGIPSPVIHDVVPEKYLILGDVLEIYRNNGV